MNNFELPCGSSFFYLFFNESYLVIDLTLKMSIRNKGIGR